MTVGFRLALTLVSLLVTTPAAAVPEKPDCSASLAAVEAAVAASCDCATAATHGQFVRCAASVVKGLAQDGSLARNCKGSMVRGYAKSSCGKDGAVTCCVARHDTTKCVVKKAAICEKLGGTTGATPYCADACISSPSGAFLD